MMRYAALLISLIICWISDKHYASCEQKMDVDSQKSVIEKYYPFLRSITDRVRQLDKSQNLVGSSKATDSTISNQSNILPMSANSIRRLMDEQEHNDVGLHDQRLTTEGLNILDPSKPKFNLNLFIEGQRYALNGQNDRGRDMGEHFIGGELGVQASTAAEDNGDGVLSDAQFQALRFLDCPKGSRKVLQRGPTSNELCSPAFQPHRLCNSYCLNNNAHRFHIRGICVETSILNHGGDIEEHRNIVDPPETCLCMHCDTTIVSEQDRANDCPFSKGRHDITTTPVEVVDQSQSKKFCSEAAFYVVESYQDLTRTVKLNNIRESLGVPQNRDMAVLRDDSNVGDKCTEFCRKKAIFIVSGECRISLNDWSVSCICYHCVKTNNNGKWR